ncbi:cupin domain-containing protein [Rhizobium sp.]
MFDPLSDMVMLLQPSAPFSKVVSGAGAWHVERSGTGQPFYCVVLEGTVQATLNSREPIALAAGDFLLVPAAFSLRMASLRVAQEGAVDPATITMLPGETRHGDPRAPADVRLLVGHFAFGSPDATLLTALLPDLLHVSGAPRLSDIVRLVTDEARAERPARDMILARLLEVLLVEALRASAGTAAPHGILRGLSDSRLAAALRIMHAEPTREWTVDRLAEETALSRSAFFNRFRRAMGVTPMDYLLSWRMALAKSLLRRQEIGMEELATRVGYGSASAFSTAFARFVGMPPSQYARQAQAA